MLLLGRFDFEQRVQFRIRVAVRIVKSIRPSEILTVVDGEIKMVERMVRRAVDDLLKRVSRNHVRVVDLNENYQINIS